MDDRQRLLLAVGITEWASTLAHLDAMDKQGLVIPPTVYGAISLELGLLVRKWPMGWGESVDKVIADARRYCTEHVADIDTVLTETRT